MENIGNWFVNHIGTLIVSGLIVGAAIIIWLIIKRAFNAAIEVSEEKEGKRNNTARAIKRIVKYAIIVIVVITVFQVNGINLTSVIASLGVAGAVVGFAGQEIIRDIFMGIRISSDGFFQEGDVIKYGDFIGVVTKFTMQSTQIRDIYSRNIISISNRRLDVVEVMSGMIDLSIGLSYTEDFEKIHRVMENLAKTMPERVPGITESIYNGTSEFNDSYITYMIAIFMEPSEMPQLKRNVLMEIQREFRTNSIEFPFPQLDVHIDQH